jgi:hypothetical protein
VVRHLHVGLAQILLKPLNGDESDHVQDGLVCDPDREVELTPRPTFVIYSISVSRPLARTTLT